MQPFYSITVTDLQKEIESLYKLLLLCNKQK